MGVGRWAGGGGVYNLTKKTVLGGVRKETRQVKSECHKKELIP